MGVSANRKGMRSALHQHCLASHQPFLNPAQTGCQESSVCRFLIVDIRTKLEQNTNIATTGESYERSCSGRRFVGVHECVSGFHGRLDRRHVMKLRFAAVF
jgi:hypothetical protein